MRRPATTSGVVESADLRPCAYDRRAPSAVHLFVPLACLGEPLNLRSNKGDMASAGEPPGVLESLGAFRIWTQLIIAPFLAIGFIIMIVVVAKMQQGWVVATATSSKDIVCEARKSGAYECADVPVSISGLDGSYTMTYRTTDIKLTAEGTTLTQHTSWTVAYDPSNVQGSLTQNVLTGRGRWLMIGGLSVALIGLIVYFVLNYKLRGNKTWRTASGVMESADIAESIIGNIAGRVGG